jgi:hypothetical protein
MTPYWKLGIQTSRSVMPLPTAKTEFVAKFTVKVVPKPLQQAAQLPLPRFDSIPELQCQTRTRKRPLGGSGYNARSSMRDFMRPADVESQEHPVGYANSNKRQRVGLQEGAGEMIRTGQCSHVKGTSKNHSTNILWVTATSR